MSTLSSNGPNQIQTPSTNVPFSPSCILYLLTTRLPSCRPQIHIHALLYLLAPCKLLYVAGRRASREQTRTSSVLHDVHLPGKQGSTALSHQEECHSLRPPSLQRTHREVRHMESHRPAAHRLISILFDLRDRLLDVFEGRV